MITTEAVTDGDQQQATNNKQRRGLRLPCLTSVLALVLLLLSHQEPHRGAEAAGHVGPAVLADQRQVQGGGVPGRRARVARPLLRVAVSPPGGQLALPVQADGLPAGGTVLPGAGGGAPRRRSSEDYRKGQEMKGLRVYVGFHDLEDAV